MCKEFYESLLAVLFMAGTGGKELKGGGIKDLAFCPEFPLCLSKVKPSIGRLNIFFPTIKMQKTLIVRKTINEK